MEMRLNFFTNDRYDILKLLSDNQVSVKEEQYINLSQQEMSDIAHYSKLKTNKILNELMDMGYVILYKNKRGKYALTDKAIKTIEIIENTII